MTSTTFPSPTETPPGGPADLPPREIGRYGSGPGPVTVLVAGIHGNEPRGIDAVRAVFEQLEHDRPTIRGTVIGLIGNRAAVAREARYLDEDLNRAFDFDLDVSRPGDEGPLHRPTLAPPPDGVEGTERRELLEAIEAAMSDLAPGEEATVIDLHTFSGDGPPFSVFSDTLRNRDFADAWPLPRILGLAEEVPGTLIAYLTSVGMRAIVVETGNHRAEASARLHESVIRLALVRAGHLTANGWPRTEGDHARLAAAVQGLPHQLDVQYRHPVVPEDRFVMRPGWTNFAPVRHDALVADDASGPLLATRTGRMLLPLYQAQGSDGFFVARPIGAVWLVLSAVLRVLRVSALARFLPGVHRHPTRPHALLVDRHVARWLAVDVFHLLGYRTLRRDPDRLLVARRQHDRRPPPRLLFDRED